MGRRIAWGLICLCLLTSLAQVERLRAIGKDAKLTEFPDAHHVFAQTFRRWPCLHSITWRHGRNSLRSQWYKLEREARAGGAAIFQRDRR